MDNGNDIQHSSTWLRVGPAAVRVTAVLVIAAGVVMALVAFPRYSVCDQQLSTAGNAVKVCRHLQITDPPVIAVGLVVLAALGVFFPEVSAFGLALKRGVADAKATALNAEAAARSAGSAAQVAEAVSLASSREGSVVAADRQLNLADEVRALAEEYNSIRRKMPSGTARTSIMTSIVSRMISLLNNVIQDQFDLAGNLNSGNPGLRLAGYAYMYANPDPRRTQEIAEAVLDEDRPFGQYWGLRALRRQFESDPSALDSNTERRLIELLGRLGPGSDRAHELREILGEA